MLLKEDIVDIEKPNGMCSLTFDVDEFSGLFLHPSIFSIIHSRVFRRYYNVTKIFILTYFFMRFKFSWF